MKAISLAALALLPLASAAHAGPGAVERHASARDFRMTVEDYPEAARSAGDRGHVLFTFVVGADGNVKACSIVQSSGSDMLDRQSCAVAERTHFRPARDKSGAAVDESWAWGINWVDPKKRDIAVDRPMPAS